jgi:hypothetical protein
VNSAEYLTATNTDSHARLSFIDKPHQTASLSETFTHDCALSSWIYKCLDRDLVDFGIYIEHVDVTEYLGDVLLGKFKVFIDILLSYTLLQHLLIFRVHGVFGKLAELGLVLVDLFELLLTSFTNNIGKTLDVLLFDALSQIRVRFP